MLEWYKKNDPVRLFNHFGRGKKLNSGPLFISPFPCLWVGRTFKESVPLCFLLIEAWK